MKPSLKRRKQQPRIRKTPGIKRSPNTGATNSSGYKDRRKARATKEAHANTGQQPLDAKKPVYDLFKGRNVYSTIDPNGRKRFVPKESDATAKEKEQGRFVKDSTIVRKGKKALSKDATPRFDNKKGRNTYPVQGKDRETIYLPKESDATQEEKNLGRYVEEKSLNLPRQAKQASEGGLPIRDLGKNRKVYPTVSEQGNQVFLPRESDATAYEKKNGLFVTDNSAAAQTQGKQMSEGKPIRDVGKNRMVYPTASSSGETVFYPRQSEATPDEIKKGQFVTDESVKDRTEKKASQKDEARYNQNNNRFEYPYEDQAGEISYLPKEDEATEEEKASGQFVNTKSTENPASQWKPIIDGKPKYKANRHLYPVTDTAGNLAYIPLEAAATQRELANGLYLPFDTIAPPGRIAARAQRAQQLHPIGPITASNTIDQERLLYATNQVNGAVRYLPKASEATKEEIANKQFIPDEETDPTTARQDLGRKPFSEATDGTPLWEGTTLPAPTAAQQKTVLGSINPIFDPEHGRMLYPIARTDGQTQYLPLAEDATPQENSDGTYAQFTTEQPLTDVVSQNIVNTTFKVAGDTIKAIAMAALATAFANAPLQLIAHKDIQERLKNTITPAQQWVG